MAKTNKRGSRNKENIPTSEGRAANKATSRQKDKEVASSPKAQEGAEQTTREINVDPQNTTTIDQALLKLMGTSSPMFAHGIVSQLNALSYVGDKLSQGNLNFLVSVVPHKLVFPHGELGYDRSLEGSITQAVERFFVGLAAIGFAALVVCLIWLLLFWLDWLDWFYEVTAG
jgi:hypothetical protein